MSLNRLKIAEKPIVKPLSHGNAREALKEAYKRLFHKDPSDGELDFGLATAFFESGYGRAGSANWAHPGQFAVWAGQNKYNWGALQSGTPGDEKTMRNFKAAGLHPTKEKGKDAGRNVYFYLFPNDVEAAMAFLMSWGKPDTLKAAASGSSEAVSKSMRNHHYYEGFWVPPGNPRNLKMPPFKEAKSAEEAERNNIRDYASALNGHLSVVTGKSHKQEQQVANRSVKPQQSILESFLNRINEFLSSFASTEDSSNKFLIIVNAEDSITKAEYARILQSVLLEELKINSNIHYHNDAVELNCSIPLKKEDGLSVLAEVCEAVSGVFEFATKKIGGCKTSAVILPERASRYPEMDIKISEINRRKFKLKIAQGYNV